MRVGLSTALCVAMSLTVVTAHAPHVGADPRVFSSWDQATVIGLCVLATVYAIGAMRLAARSVQKSRVEYCAFGVGWFVLLFAVLPWIDAATIERFSAHMGQHELMMLVGAPLLIVGRPLSTSLWALPATWRRVGILPLQHRVTARAVRTLTTPAVAWALHGAVLWIWHMPLFYDLAVKSEPAHAVQHAMFVGTSLMFWGGLLYGRYGRAGYGAAVFFVFTTAVHTGLLGALIMGSRTPLYSSYAHLPGMSGESALADQQIAGLVMWIPAGVLMTLVGIALFAAWLGEADRRARLSGH